VLHAAAGGKFEARADIPVMDLFGPKFRSLRVIFTITAAEMTPV
jgi:hypothetical protein